MARNKGKTITALPVTYGHETVNDAPNTKNGTKT